MLNYRPIKEALLSFSLSLFALLFAILLPFMRSMSDRHIRIYNIQESVFKSLSFFFFSRFISKFSMTYLHLVSNSLSLFFSLVEIGIYIHMKFALMMMVVMMLMCFDQHLNLRVMCASLRFLMMMMMIDEIMRLKATLIEKKLNHRFLCIN